MQGAIRDGMSPFVNPEKQILDANAYQELFQK